MEISARVLLPAAGCRQARPSDFLSRRCTIVGTLILINVDDTINILIRHFLDNHPPILIPTYEGKKGHPPLFSINLRAEFLALDNESGLNTIAHAHQAETAVLPVEDVGVISAFNTLDEFERIKNLR